MPNPFFNRQKATSTNVPDRQRITPVPESYAGDNHPYRGTENHGVPDTENPHDPSVEFDNEATHLIVYDEEVPEPEPIPVKVMNQAGGRRVGFRTFRTVVPIDGTPIQVLGRNDKRRNLTILNNGDRSVAIAPTPADLISRPSGVAAANTGNGGNGFVIYAGNTLTFTMQTTEAIWACKSADTNAAALAVEELVIYYEYEIEVDDRL